MECKINTSEISNFLLVLGNNQDGCLLTGDHVDVLEFRKVFPTIFDSPFNSYKIAVGMSTCCFYSGISLKFWGKIVGNIFKSEEEKNILFKKFVFDENILSVKIGDSHILILSETGRVFCVGDGPQGQLGLGSGQQSVDYPVLIKIPKIKINKIFTGVRTSFLIDGIS
jgi:hypothetical protein